MNQLKDIRLQQYLMNKKLQKMYSPYADTDKDGFVNMMDCYPFDPKRHGVWGWIKKNILRQPETKVETKEIPAPEPTGIRVVDIVKKDPETGKTTGGGNIIIRGKDAWERPVRRGGGGGGRSPTTVSVSATGDVFESEIEEFGQKKGIIAPPIQVKEEPKTEVERLRTEPAVIDVAKPLTETQIQTGKDIEKQYKKDQFKKRFWDEPVEKFQSAFESLPAVDLTPTTYWADAPATVVDVPDVPRRETVVTRPPTTKELEEGKYFWAVKRGELNYEQMLETQKVEMKATETANRVAGDVSAKAKNLADKKFNEIQNQVNAGKITVEQGQKKLDAYVENLNKRTNKEFDYKFNKDMKPYIDSVSKKLEISRNKAIEEVKKRVDKDSLGLKTTGAVLTGVVYGAVGTAVPAIGAGFIAGGGTYLATGGGQKIVEAFKEQPYTTGFKLGGGIAGAMVGGGLVGYGKGKFVKGKTAEAIRRGTVKTKYTDLTKAVQLRKVKLTSAQKLQVRTLIDRGYTIRLVKTSLKPAKGFQKYTPKVKGQFVEVLSRKGKVVDRFSLGTVKASFRGKPLQADIYNIAKGQIAKGRIDYLSRTWGFKRLTRYKPTEGRWVSKTGKPLSYAEMIERAKVLSYDQLPSRYFKITGRAELKQLTKITKPKWIKKQPVQRPTLADLEMGRAWWGDTKTYGKADIRYVGRTVRTEAVIMGKPRLGGFDMGFIGAKTDIGVGRSIFRRIIPKKTPQGKIPKTARVYPDFPEITWQRIKPTKDIIPKSLRNIIKQAPKGSQEWVRGQVLAHHRVSGKWISKSWVRELVKKSRPTKPAGGTPFEGQISRAGFNRLRQQTQSSYQQYQQIQQPMQSYALEVPSKTYGAITSQTVASLTPSYAFSSTLVSGVRGGVIGTTMTKTRVRQLQKIRMEQRMRQQNITKMYSEQLMRIGSEAKMQTRVQTVQVTKLQTKLRQKQVTKLKTKQTTPFSPIIPPIRIPFQPTFPFPKPRPENGTKRKRRKGNGYIKALKKAYQPSVGAVALGITAKKKPTTLTGLELRPVVKKRKGIKRRNSNYLQNVNKILG